MSTLAIPRWLRLPHTSNFQSIILRADPGILAELVPLLDALPVPAAALHRPRMVWIGWDGQWCWLGTPAPGDARWLVPVLSTIRNWADARECYHDSGEQPIFGEGAPDVWWPWYVFTRDRRGGVWIRGVSQPANPFPLHQLAGESAHARTTPAGQRFEQVGNALHRTGLPVTYPFALQLYRAGYGLWNGPPDLRRRCQAFAPSDLTPPESLQNLANQLHNTRWGPAARYAELLDRAPTVLRRALLR